MDLWGIHCISESLDLWIVWRGGVGWEGWEGWKDFSRILAGSSTIEAAFTVFKGGFGIVVGFLEILWDF